MYRCIGVPKRHLFHFSHYEGCGEIWSEDYDRCPHCRGYLIPDSMITEEHGQNEDKQSDTEITEEDNAIMPKIRFEIVNYEYSSYEEYLQHAVYMTSNGWEFQSQNSNHKEVSWTKSYK